MKLISKCKLIDNSEKVFGDGPLDLIIQIDKLGSISGAAKALGISYSKAHRIIKNSEQKLNFKLLDKKSGGKDGGGSSLTKRASEFISDYTKCTNEIFDCTEKISKKYLGKYFK